MYDLGFIRSRRSKWSAADWRLSLRLTRRRRISALVRWLPMQSPNLPTAIPPDLSIVRQPRPVLNLITSHHFLPKLKKSPKNRPPALRSDWQQILVLQPKTSLSAEKYRALIIIRISQLMPVQLYFGIFNVYMLVQLWRWERIPIIRVWIYQVYTEPYWVMYTWMWINSSRTQHLVRLRSQHTSRVVCHLPL